MTVTDNDLLDLFAARDPGAISALERRYGPYCRAIVRNLLSDERDREECLSDCWLAVWNAVPPARPDNFRGWLGAVVRNRAIAMGKQNGRRPPTVDQSALELAPCLPHTGPQARVEADELARAVSAFLRQETPEVRTAFLRRYWYADTVEDTAARMGWTVSKTKTVLFRLRARLRNYLETEGYL